MHVGWFVVLTRHISEHICIEKCDILSLQSSRRWKIRRMVIKSRDKDEMRLKKESK
jgi:hypothetical protein